MAKCKMFLILALCVVVAVCGACNNPNSGDGNNNGDGAVEDGYMYTQIKSVSQELPVTLTGDTMVYDASQLGVVKGVEDMAAAIEDAVRQVQQKGGGILFFPDGVYRVSRGVVIEGGADSPAVVITGDSGSLSQCQFSSTSDVEDAVITISAPNVCISNVRIVNNSTAAAGVHMASDGGSLSSVSFATPKSANKNPAIIISGSYNTIQSCGFGPGCANYYIIKFTATESRRAYGNVLADCYFGGTFEKSVLVTSEDGRSAQENLIFMRNVFLLSAEPQIEINAVIGMSIINNMLDAATKAVVCQPTGLGVHDVEIAFCYLGTAKGGVHLLESDVQSGGFKIHDNYFWTPNAVWVTGSNFSDISIEHNYFVLTGGDGIFLSAARNSVIRDSLVTNIAGVLTVFQVMSRDAESIFEDNNFGGESLIADENTLSADIPAYVKPQTGDAPQDTRAKLPDVTGDVAYSAVEHKNYINVMDYGAVGDGVTDDTEALRTAINRAYSANKTVYFPSGTYLISETITTKRDDSKLLLFKGDGASSKLVGAASLNGPMFLNEMKYNFSVRNLSFEHLGVGECIDALFLSLDSCYFTASDSNTAPLLRFHGSDCRVMRSNFTTKNPEAYSVCYTKLDDEISINDYIADNTFDGVGKGILVGNGEASSSGRCEGLKISNNVFTNSGATQIEVYEILHIDISYNVMSGADTAIMLSCLGHGPDGVFINNNDISATSVDLTARAVEGGGDYVSMVVASYNDLNGGEITEELPFNKKMLHDNFE